jgi:predicted nucleic acid-binding protein
LATSSTNGVIDTLIDAGPLLATINRNDNWHRESAALLRRLDCPFYTTLPVITEAMHLLGRHTGATGQQALWRLILRGDLLVEHPTQRDLHRMADLMSRYADRPMDFADASLVAISERLGLDRIVTLDRTDFSIYRRHDRKPFIIVGP